MSDVPSVLNEISKFADVFSGGIVTLDSEQRIVLWNSWMVERSDILSQNAVGRTLPELFPEVVNTRLSSAIDYAVNKSLPSLLSPRTMANC